MNKVNEEKTKQEQDLDILRYFAGCGPLEIEVEKAKDITEVTTSTEEMYTDFDITTTMDMDLVTDVNTGEQNLPAEPEPDPEITAPDLTFQVPFFFPNNYSGVDYPTDKAKALEEMFINGTRADSTTTGYELKKSTSTGLTFDNGGLKGNTYTSRGGRWNGQHPYYFGKNRYGQIQSWYYQINEKKAEESLSDDSRYDAVSFGLNYDAFGGDSLYQRVVNMDYLLGHSGNSVNWEESTNSGLTAIKRILGVHLKDLNYVLPAYFVYTGGIKDILKLIEEKITPKPSYKIKIDCIGYASTHGYSGLNQTLSEERANTVVDWFKKYSGLGDMVEIGEVNGNGQLTKGPGVSSVDAKVSRCAVLTINFVRDKTKEEPKPSNEETEETIEPVKHEIETITESERFRLLNKNLYEITSVKDKIDPVQTYDEEYRYFKQLNEDGDEYFIKKYISDKVKYFDPAFHSISPEGFNARLTFLHQCTRQGPTLAATDEEKQTHSMGAGNLSFGRPPFCVLRVGDFFFTKICIDSINIQYENGDGIQWDMNPEGIGLQPMFANVDISFTFLGGSDLSGPIDRLQNAVSHNYYANTSVYERKADFRDNFREGSGKEGHDEAYMWEANLNTKSNDPIENLSRHIKWSATNPIEEQDELGLGKKLVQQEVELLNEDDIKNIRKKDLEEKGIIYPSAIGDKMMLDETGRVFAKAQRDRRLRMAPEQDLSSLMIKPGVGPNSW